jgi:hypothetical protein
MRRFFGFVLLTACCFSSCIPATARTKNPALVESRDSQKANRKQAKANRKYAKAQRKAQNKMFKNSQKKTHYPPQAF